MAETEEKAVSDKKELGLAKPWLDKIDAAIKREDKWRERGKKVVQRFRDERDRKPSEDSNARINILWANKEVLQSALYSRTAIPDVRRRFPDANNGDPLARTAAEVIERALSYCNDSYDVDSPVEDAVADYLLPGRGTAWIVYEPEIVGEGDEAKVGEQTLREEFVYWEDFCHGEARRWERVPWVARRHAPTVSEFKGRFPKAREAPDADFKLKDASGDSSDDGFVELWEVWDKGSRDRIYVARGFLNEVQRDEDPLKLIGFFPCPKPLYSVSTTDRLIPEPEYCLYQDQAEELDRVAYRIRALLEQLKWKGVYDGSIDGENVLSTLAGSPDGTFLPYVNWGNLKDKGGIDAAVGFWPMDKIIAVLRQLYPRAQQLIQEIYQITGISDIVRGSTDPGETLGAQQLKAQFGSMRMQKRQREVQRFIRDLYRMKAEIIAEHFTQETLAAITSIDLPTLEEQEQIKAQIAQAEQAKEQAAAMTGHNGGPPMDGPPMPMPPGGMTGTFPPPDMTPMGMPPDMPPQMGGGGAMAAAPPPPEVPEVPEELIARATGPNWDDILDLLRSDKMRGYRVDVETDSTIFVDADAEKNSRIEFMTAAGTMLQQAMGMIAMAPASIPLVREMMLFGIRSFKPGRTLEEAFEDAFDALAENPPAPPDEGKDVPEEKGPDLKGMASIAEVKRKQQRDAQEIELDKARFGVEASDAVAERERKDALAEAEIKEGEVGAMVDAFKAEAGAGVAMQKADDAAMIARQRAAQRPANGAR